MLAAQLVAYGETLERRLAPSTLVTQFVGLSVLILIGLCASVVAIKFGEPSKKKLILLAGVAVLPLACAVTRSPRSVFLFIFVLLLPYNRMYYKLDPVFGDHGTQGMYIIPADVAFGALLAIWAFEIVVLKRPLRGHGSRLWPWWIPFIITCFLSGLNASRMSWSMFEVYRMLKFMLVLVYLRYNLDREGFWAIVAALGCSTLLQATMAGMQMTLRSASGLLGLLGGGGGGGSLEELGSLAVGGWIRAVGTLGHPSNLACYLLMPIPLFLALAVSLRHSLLKLICGIVSVAGLSGLALTLSRWPCALMVGMLALLIIGLTWLGYLSAKRAIGLASVTAFLVAASLLPAADFIHERLTRDLGASLDFRAKDRAIALDIFEKSPLLGIGPNNYAVYLPDYDPEIRWALENANKARLTLNIRTFVALHNFYLFMLAETGLIGSLALIFFYLGVVLLGVRSIARTTGFWRAASLGILIGLLGVYGQGAIDFSFWVDPIYYTFALMAGTMVKLPVLEAESATTPTGGISS